MEKQTKILSGLVLVTVAAGCAVGGSGGMESQLSSAERTQLHALGIEALHAEDEMVRLFNAAGEDVGVVRFDEEGYAVGSHS